MRKGRSNKGSDNSGSSFSSGKGESMVYLIVFLSGFLGILAGYLFGKIATITFIVGVAVFLGILVSALIVAKSISDQNQIIHNGFLQEKATEKYNALTILLKELEYNLNVNSSENFKLNEWKGLRYELSFFPGPLYEMIELAYENLAKLHDLEGSQLQDVLYSELKLPGVIAGIRDQQQKIKRSMM